MTGTEAGIHSNAYVIYEFERRAYPISDMPVRIGRDASNDIVLRESAVSRFNTEVRRENDRCIVHTLGATPAVIDGVPVTDQAPLNEGTRIEIGSAVLTFTEKRLPIGVSVVERASRKEKKRDDIGNRRDTIKNPLMKGSSDDKERDPLLRAKILGVIAVIVVLLFLFGR
jgi:pSer/pThr/pTyr-binding forkhead associated (FHA) protein